ncbi:TonB-dependent receptor [Chryseobacterium carnipullorum]|uniref:Outer membrane cobalamin receptor protein n=1 Tax=Chryseobacterium carnipullorum TaxID=1124835 RepID=A0A376EV88_CHRCU|nr:TonB-dependent receptor [Chryseobacterium carnipullorum]AZA48141.1 TonB-dependent receptor [Chryseobacterium carnipullorum]AZA67450.1 TonB-dependent receptor [Chryseobacterium carnipullorum]STD14213.1 Outer membrane cobalamin receptor protein [Chryseobacterium carnipullorum]
MKGLFFLGLTVGSAAFIQAQNKDSLKIREIEAVNFTKRLPVAKEIINVQKDIDSRNLGQDLPILLKNQTSIISTSDAGNGVGYTGFRIRGVSGKGINVMMNGVPYNDSESQGTFFVNVPDLTSSASQIVIQRGVGTSNNGVSAFGASINVISKEPDEKMYFKTDDSYGSFNTYKYSAEAGSGKFWKNRLSVMGRYTRIHSDGYIDRASSNLDSYNFTALFEEGKTRLRLMAFGGKEKTYQAWNGIDRPTWETNPKFNYSGQYTDLFTGEEKFYDNETDNYRQNHYQLLWEQKFNDNWSLETTFHYTKGRGYYENYKRVDETDVDATHYSSYNLPVPIVNGSAVEQTDFIRKKWLDNDFYGAVSTLYGKFENVDLNFGLVANQYYGRHFGNVTGVYFPMVNEYEYYRNRSVKTEVAGFAKALWRTGEHFEFFGDLQLRNIDYNTKIITAGDGEGGNLDKNWLFFNPKAGVNYKIGSGKVFLSYAHAQREPNRDDLMSDNDVKAEKLHDFEAGIEKQFGILSVTANLYYMYYVNQLVLNGQLNNVGAFIRTNSGKSYRRGVEIGALAKLSKQWEVTGNVSLSQNRNLDFNIKNNGTLQSLGDTEISFSPNVIANLGLKFNPDKNFQFALMNQYVGKQYLDNTGNKNLELKDYFLTDFNAQYQFKIASNDIELKLLVNNLFNKKYVNNGAVYDGDPYYFSQAGTNFMFGISWKIQ